MQIFLRKFSSKSRDKNETKIEVEDEKQAEEIFCKRNRSVMHKTNLS